MANSGHFDAELDLPALREMAEGHVRDVRPNVQEFDLGGKRLNLVAEGRLVNLGAAEGHPAAVMDMSFANQALAAEYVALHHAELEPQGVRRARGDRRRGRAAQARGDGHHARPDDARAARVRLELAARHLDPDDRGRGAREPAEAAGPRSSRRTAAGRRRSTSSWSRRRRSASPRRRWTATTCTGSRAGRPRAAGGRCSGTGSTARPASSRRRRSTSRNRVHEYGGASYVVGRRSSSSRRTPPTAGCTAWTRQGACRARRASPRPARGATPTCAFDPVRDAAVRRPRDARRGDASTTRCWSSTSSSRSRSTDRTARAASSSRGPDFVAAPRPSPDGSRARLDRVGPPGHALGRDPAAGRRRRGPTGRWASRGRSPADRGSPSSSRAGARRASCTPSRTRPSWWNLYAFDGPDGTDGAGAQPRADGRRAGRARPGCSGSAPTGSSPTGRSSRSPARDGHGRHRPDRRATARSPASTAVHRGALVPRRRRRGDRRDRRRPARRRDPRPPRRARPARSAGVLARSLRGLAGPGATCRSPSRSRSRTAERRHGPGALLRADQPGVPRPGRRAAAAHRRCRTAARPAPRTPRCRSTGRSSPRAASRSSTSTTAGRSGYGRPYRDALKGQWGIADVEDCVAAAEFLVDRGSVDPTRLAIRGGSAGGYTTLAALDVPAARCSRRASATSASPTSSSSTTTATSSSRATTRGCWRRGPRRAAGCSASARRSTTSTGCARRCSCSRAWTTGSCRRRSWTRWRRRSSRVASRTSRCGSRARATGSGAPTRGGRRTRRSSRSSAACSASRRTTTCRRSRSRAWTTFAAAMAGATAGGDLR